MVSVNFWLAVLEALSVTVTVKVTPLAAAFGVPVIAPAVEFNDSGAGRDPEVIDHV